MTTTADLREHALSIAAEHGIEIEYTRNYDRARSWRRDRRIRIPEIKGQVSYLIALHEIAHIAGPNPPTRLSKEIAAWQWALDVSMIEPSPATYRSIIGCLQNYRRWQQRHATAVCPPGYDAYVRRLEKVAS